ncbi:MAG: hypothetical protein R3D27_00835 [Hyphomicrobiaceae bacterium]
MTNDPHRNDPPFRHTPFVYIAMKWLVLTVAVILALRYFANVSLLP